MAILKLTGKDLRALGYAEGAVIGVAIDTMAKNCKHMHREEALKLLQDILAAPAHYANDKKVGAIANALVQQQLRAANNAGKQVGLQAMPMPFEVFGKAFIEEGALQQMSQAARLPIAVAGALMPDAHHGYGLPIGGVLAVENAVIPYGVGVDIGCRMCLSVFDILPDDLRIRQPFFERTLHENTLFGSGRTFAGATDHEVLYRKEFDEIEALRPLKERARQQLGTSGGGNHFVEFGVVEIKDYDPVLNITPGKYVGLLSHSGSRAVGANIANHYTRLAKEKRKLPGEAANLAWLTLHEEEGITYFAAMNLAGDYASACHHVIHQKIARQLGMQPIRMVENHHNFAWKEQYEGREVIVHRKGATPAGKDILGIIPGSMTAQGFIVKGKGFAASINSASHGAGRVMSRTAALQHIKASQLKQELDKFGVKLLGGGLDEAPFAYKDIHQVMQAQQHLVEVVGAFTPKIVKMDDTPPRKQKWRDIANGE